MENNDCGAHRVRAPSEKLGAHESEGATDSRNLPRESSPTRRAEKAAREYGGVCSTESPDENVRLLMGGDVCAARYGSTERNVEGGISAEEKGVRISGRQGHRGELAYAAGAVPAAPDFIEPDHPSPAHNALCGDRSVGCALENVRQLTGELLVPFTFVAHHIRCDWCTPHLQTELCQRRADERCALRLDWEDALAGWLRFARSLHGGEPLVQLRRVTHHVPGLHLEGLDILQRIF